MLEDQQDELIYAIQQKQYYDNRVKKLLAIRKNQAAQQMKPQQESKSESWEAEGIIGDLSLKKVSSNKSEKAG